MKRDKFLTEAMGYCYHTWKKCNPQALDDYRCSKCKDYASTTKIYKINFSTWEGFGKLWKWSQKQSWLKDFWYYNELPEAHIHEFLINPKRFADAVYEYLKEVERRKLWYVQEDISP